MKYIRSIAQYASILLLFISLFGSWRKGYSSSFFMQLTSYPEYLLGFNTFLNMLKILLVFMVLIILVRASKNSTIINMLGVIFSGGLLLLTLLWSYIAVVFEGFPSRESSNEVLGLGFGPFLAAFSLIYLLLMFLGNLIQLMKSKST